MSLRVLHLVGSADSDLLADLSRVYAADCLECSADLPEVESAIAYVNPGGAWCFPTDLTRAAIASAPALPLPDALRVVADLAIDVALPQMFCLPGMTHYRALLDLLDIPYAGNPAGVMALGADKAKASAIVASSGARVPASQVARPGTPLALSPPVVVKPVDADNSLGVTLVRTPVAYADAVEVACRHSDRALVESYVELGREVRCGVVDVAGQLWALPLEEYAVDPAAPIRHHADKLRRADDGALGLVAKDAEHAWIVDLADPVTPRVQASALRCYEALGCRDYGLFDFRVDPQGEVWFLEASLYCSYARTSVLVVMAEAAGIPLSRLLRLGLHHALGRRSSVPHPIAR